jgi:large subunit ribosomal protein L4
MNITVFDTNYKELKTIGLDQSVFGHEYREDIIHAVIRWQLAKKRSGCHKAKSIGEISGGGRKPYKQKGTGRARQGSIRSPQFRGGAVIFGPIVRSHEHKLNKKIKSLGLKVSLSRKFRDQNLVIFDQYKLEDYKTKHALALFKDYESVLVIGDSKLDEKFFQSIKNIPKVKVLDYKGTNVYDVVANQKVFISEMCLNHIQGRLV